MKQYTTAGIAVDSEESKAIDDVAVIEERNVVNDVVYHLPIIYAFFIYYYLSSTIYRLSSTVIYHLSSTIYLSSIYHLCIF